MKKRYVIHIRGKVQGVFFRVLAKEQAEKLGLTGFIRNEEDGSVHTEVEGDSQALEEFAAWCKEGPTGARVKVVDIRGEATMGFRSFEIQ